MDQPRIHNNQQSSLSFPSAVSEPDTPKQSTLRRASISDTHLPRLDIPHFVSPQENNPFNRVLSGLIEGSSNLSLNKFNSGPDVRHTHQSTLGQHQQTTPSLSSSFDRNKSAFELGGFEKNHYSTGINTLQPPKSDSSILRKSASVANYALSGHLSPTSHAILGRGSSTHQIHTIPEQESDQGLTMNMSSARPVATSGIAAAANAALSNPTLGSSPPDRKASPFGGLASMMSGLFNKPITHLGDREENYRYIMALDR